MYLIPIVNVVMVLPWSAKSIVPSPAEYCESNPMFVWLQRVDALLCCANADAMMDNDSNATYES